MPGKLDFTERSFNKFPTPPETSGWPLAKVDSQWGHMSGESMTTPLLNTVPTIQFPRWKLFYHRLNTKAFAIDAPIT